MKDKHLYSVEKQLYNILCIGNSRKFRKVSGRAISIKESGGFLKEGLSRGNSGKFLYCIILLYVEKISKNSGRFQEV